MFSLIALPVLAAAIAGLVVKFWLDRTESHMEITWAEYLVMLLVISVIVSPLASWIGFKIALSSQISYNEYWNGWETAARREVTVCTKNGPCRWEYGCEPHPVSYSCNCDDDGCDICWKIESHDCPYCTEEYHYFVDTTLGTYEIAKHRLPDNPEANRWMGTSDYEAYIDQWTIDQAGIGAPEFWLGVLRRTQNNTVPGGGVTKVMQYDNLILASQLTLLKEYSSDIDRFLEAGLLPPMTIGIYDWYMADKVHFVGFTPDNAAVWQRAVLDLNAALGGELEGDSHWVIVQSDEVSANPDAYVMALKAYWQLSYQENEEGKDVKLWGDNCISKNGVIVVIGTRDGLTVDWARLETGMPGGNEWLMVKINRRLKGVSLTPETVVGIVRGEFYTKTYDDGRPPKQKVQGLHADGALERLLWALDDDSDNLGFVRVSMSGDDPEDVGTGYLFLKGEIQPTGGQKTMITIGTFLISLLGWWAVAAFGERAGRGRRHYRSQRYYR